MRAFVEGQRARTARRVNGRGGAHDVSDLPDLRRVKVVPAVEQVLSAQDASTRRLRPDSKVGGRADALTPNPSVAPRTVTHVGDRMQRR